MSAEEPRQQPEIVRKNWSLETRPDGSKFIGIVSHQGGVDYIRHVVNEIGAQERDKPQDMHESFVPDIVVGVGVTEEVIVEYVNSEGSLFRDYGAMCALKGERAAKKKEAEGYVVAVLDSLMETEAGKALNAFGGHVTEAGPAFIKLSAIKEELLWRMESVAAYKARKLHDQLYGPTKKSPTPLADQRKLALETEP